MAELHISGLDQSPRVMEGSLSVGLRLFARGSCSFWMHAADGYRAAIGEFVHVFEASGLMWAGLIVQIVEEVRIGGDAPDVLLKIECVSYEALLDERVIEAETFTDSTCGDICRYIIATYLFEDGFDEGLIEDGITLERYNIDHKTASEVFEELSKLCDFIWYSDQLKQLDFRSATATPAPFEITDENAPITSISVERSSVDYKNQIWRRIAPEALVPESQTFHGDGSTRTWDLDHKAGSIISITLDTGSGPFEQSVGYEGTDTGVPFYWTEGGTQIRQDSGETVLTSSDDLVVTYRKFGAAVVFSQDETEITIRSGIEATSGKKGLVVDDTSNTNAAAAQLANDAALAAAARLPRIVRFTTSTEFPRPGYVVPIDRATPSVVGDFLITDVDARGNEDGGFDYSCTATDLTRYPGWQEWLKTLRDGKGSGAVTFIGGSDAPTGYVDVPYNEATGCYRLDLGQGGNFRIVLERDSFPLVNAGLETGDLSGWTSDNPSLTGADDTIYQGAGGYSLRLDEDAGAHGVYQEVEGLTEGVDYWVFGLVRGTSGGTATTRLEVDDSTGSGLVQSASMTPGVSWTRHSVNFTATATGKARVKVRRGPGGTGSVYWDNVSVGPLVLAPVSADGTIAAGQPLALFIDQDETGGHVAPAFATGPGSFAGSVNNNGISGAPLTRTSYFFTYHGDIWGLTGFLTGQLTN